jgi:3-hydroxybutyryl-CoA dehydrogenase
VSARVKLVRRQESRSFPQGQTPFGQAQNPDVLILAGDAAGRELGSIDPPRWTAVLVELSTECLGVYTDTGDAEGASTGLGFARFVLGASKPSNLVEVVRQLGSAESAIRAAREVFTTIGWSVSVCMDFPGRIVDRLVRPYFNAALVAVDEGRASIDDLDLIVELGLSYPQGPIRVLERTGLHHHALVSRELFTAYGEQSLVPARRARLALERVGTLE